MAVTIAIPFYNAEKYLMDSIKSVFSQTYKNWELILIDDGSTDDSLKIAKSVKDKRVKVISDGKNKKLATRLNEVTHLAKYDYIARMDADDLMHPERIEIQVNFLETNKEFDLISTGTYSINNQGEVLGYRFNSSINPSVHEILYRKINILHASILARKEWYLRNKYDESLILGQDTELWLRTSFKNDLRIKILPDLLYLYREENNISKQKLFRAYKNQRNVTIKYNRTNILKIKFYLTSVLKTIYIGVLGPSEKLLKRRNLNNNKQFLKEGAKIVDMITNYNFYE